MDLTNNTNHYCTVGHWKLFFDWVRETFYHLMSKNEENALQKAIDSNVADIPSCLCCRDRQKCVWLLHVKASLQTAIRDEVILSLKNRKENAKGRRKQLYQHINKKIAGCKPGQRRVLPNCITAGVRGLIYGDGSRVGYKATSQDG